MSVFFDRVLLLVLLLVLVPACGRQRPGGGDDDDDSIGAGGDDDDADCNGEVICGGGGGGEGEATDEYVGTASGTWNGASVEGDVAITVRGGFADVALAVTRSSSGDLVFTAEQQGAVDIDQFGNMIGELWGQGPSFSGYISFTGAVEGDAATGDWRGESSDESGSWSADLVE